ncbi:MAG: transposase [Moraxellaceae bacterium]|nr:transposase [Moraxellaceae bacterium]
MSSKRPCRASIARHWAPTKGMHAQEFVAACRGINITPHVAQNDSGNRRSAIDERTTRHEGYAISMNKRKLIETTFGWRKQYGGLRRVMLRGLERVGNRVMLVLCAFNLLRMRNIAENAVI